MYVYSDNQVLSSSIVIGEKVKTMLLAIKSIVMFIFHQKDTVYFLAGKGVAIGSTYIVATTELTYHIA